MILIQGVQAKVAKINYTPAEYRNILRMTRRTHLLVEGKMDKRFFSTLIDEWRQEDLVGVSTSGFDVDIDTAETLIEFLPPLGNREKVEIICQEVAKTDFAVRLVGFVDREYREFCANPGELEDTIRGHHIEGRLIWSRGHSFENYFFDTDVLHTPLRDSCTADNTEVALVLLKRVLPSLLRIACAPRYVARVSQDQHPSMVQPTGGY